MSSIAFVVEGQSDVILLRKLLGKRTYASFRFYAAGGRTSLATIGRNILVHEGGPLMIVMDADTLDPSQAESSCRMVEVTLRHVSPDDRFDVFAFVPEFEIVFFEASTVLTRKFGAKIVNQSVIDSGQFRPKRTLQQLLHDSGISTERFFRELTVREVVELRQGRQASRFLSAVEDLMVVVGR